MKFIYLFLITAFLFGCDSNTSTDNSAPSKGEPRELTTAERCANVGIKEFMSNYPSHLGVELHSYTITEEKPAGEGAQPYGINVSFDMDYTFSGNRMKQNYSKFCKIDYGY